MYRVTDSYGTKKTCWTWRTAMSWLAVCSPDASIHNQVTGALLAYRTWVRTN